MAMDRKRICRITSVILIISIIFFASLGYFYYLDLKKALVEKISDKAAFIIGQKVDIRDISFSPSAGINLYDIIVKNPEDFNSGQLLKIKSLHLNMKLSELLKGRFYLKNIVVYSPELTLMRNKDGRSNISHELMFFLSEKSGLRYQVDVFNIKSGTIDFNKDIRYRNNNINLTIKNLSSSPGVKTLINGSTSSAGGNRIMINGWAYLQDEPKKFNVSVFSKDFVLSAFREFFERHRLDTEKTEINMRLDAEGDTETGFNLKSEIQIKNAGAFFLNEDLMDIWIDTEVFYDIRNSSVTINKLLLNAGDVSAVQLKGLIKEIQKNPSYSAEIKINRLDLSAFNLHEKLRVSGIMTSDNITIKGKLGKTMPEISGSVQLRDASIKSDKADYKIQRLNSSLQIDYRKNVFTIKDLRIETEELNSTAGMIKIVMPEKKGRFLIEIKDMETASKFSKIPYSISGYIKSAFFEGTIDSADSLHGNASVDAEKISVLAIDTKRNILKDAFLRSEIIFKGKDLEFKADAGVRDILLGFSGSVKGFLEKERSAEIKTTLPDIKVTAIRDSLWDIFPDRLLYAGLDGYISSDISIDYSNSGLKVSGELRLKNFILEGEYGEYSAGPINGIIPISYDKAINDQKAIKIPLFERSAFNNQDNLFSQETLLDGFSRITIGSLSYGFRLIDNINIWINQKGSVLNIGRFSGNIFGGRLYGSAVINMSDELDYRAGFILKGLSLRKLCEGIEPIKGYISGKVDGIVNLKGSGTGISHLIGKADFWTYSDRNEKTEISRKFLLKIAGPSLKTYLGDRRFDKGIMSLYLQDGFVIFKELEISNRNFLGITDLSVKVAPFNNRIAIDHLMWTITEAAQRAKEE